MKKAIIAFSKALEQEEATLKGIKEKLVEAADWIFRDDEIAELNRRKTFTEETIAEGTKAIRVLKDYERKKEKNKIPPDIEEVKQYFIDQKIIDPIANAEKWWHSYNAKGWMIGKVKMTKWKSGVATWGFAREVGVVKSKATSTERLSGDF